MGSNYVDTSAIVQVIGCVFKHPYLLDLGDKYFITEDDFQNELHKVIFGCIYKLHELGAHVITLNSIADFLETRPKYKAIYDKKGDEWILRATEKADLSTFDYYYNRMKKFTLLRGLDSCGIDVTDIYDAGNAFDIKKRQAQEVWLDNASIQDIVEQVNRKIDGVYLKYASKIESRMIQAGDGVDDLIDELKLKPEVGVPLYGTFMNTVTRGARLKKFYLRSAPTGVGKTRTMIADACYIACNKLYDPQFGWVSNGKKESVVYITTEQEKDEVQTMMLAFLAYVDEDHILNGRYEDGEEERIRKAAAILKDSNIYIEELPDFSLQDIEDTIKKHIRDHETNYIFFDYIHTSLKILEEITKKTGGVKLREDNILFMLSIRLKDLCNKYGVFILSSTQLNGDYVNSDTPDQNLLRGAKAIADKIDWGGILLPVTESDIKSLDAILEHSSFERPNIKLSIYKNRRGRYKGIILWCKGELSTCRVNPIFATSYSYELLNLKDMKITVEEDSAFEGD